MKNSIDSFIDYFFSLKGYEIALLGNLIGICLSAPLNSNQQNILGNFFELIGEEILTIQARDQANSSNNNIDLSKIYKELNFKIEYIEDLIQYIKNKMK